MSVDSDRFAEALTNLLDNALRHTPPGGRVTIAIGHTHRWDSDLARLAMTDTGEGFDPTEADRLFERFYRTDPARTPGAAGSGIGLTITKAIINAHHATINAHSAGPGRGATFDITLPATPPHHGGVNATGSQPCSRNPNGSGIGSALLRSSRDGRDHSVGGCDRDTPRVAAIRQSHQGDYSRGSTGSSRSWRDRRASRMFPIKPTVQPKLGDPPARLRHCPSERSLIAMLTGTFKRIPGTLALAAMAALLISACSSSGDTTPTRYAAKPTARTSGTATSGTGQLPTPNASTGNEPASAAEPLPTGDGLRASMVGLTFTPSTTSLSAGAQTAFSFRIVDTNGKTFTTFAPEQTKLMHLYLVRSDLTGFQHIHPSMASDGTWTAPAQPLQPGSYRAYVAFVASDSSGDRISLVLGDKLSVPGTAATVALPPPSTTTQVDGYTVSVGGPALKAGVAGSVSITVTKAGAPVTDLQPYLGSFAHAVAAHEGDLAFAYLPPQGDTTGNQGGPTLSFVAAPSVAGAWRLFLQFQAGGTVHTGAITMTVG